MNEPEYWVHTEATGSDLSATYANFPVDSLYSTVTEDAIFA